MSKLWRCFCRVAGVSRALRARCVLGLVVGVGVLGQAGCERKTAAGAPEPTTRPAVPVTVAEAQRADVPVELRVIARGEAYRTVTVRPQVAGQLTRLHFEEGQDVREGELLFSLDARTFEATLLQAQGALARDSALARDARSEANRQTELYKQNVAAPREYESAVAQADAAEATVQADQAQVDFARAQVEYCSIRAPISGRTGARLTDVGNVVKANETQLVVINQISPIFVTFAVPEAQLAEIKRHQAERVLRVRAEFPTAAEGPAEIGELTFIDNQVNASTGMITLKGTFGNERRRLWPGQYVTAVLEITTRPQAVVVPTRAVQIGQTGQFVYVVGADDQVELRMVKAGPEYANRMVLEEGVAPGERVITEGHLRVVPGAKVQVRPAGGAPTEPSGAPTSAESHG